MFQGRLGWGVAGGVCSKVGWGGGEAGGVCSKVGWGVVGAGGIVFVGEACFSPLGNYT